jgi:putative MATE family efflux protein
MIFGLVGTGTTALVSRAWGAGDFTLANRVMNRSLMLATCLGCVFCGFIYALAPTVAGLLNLNAEASAIAIHYVRVDGFGNIFTSISLIAAAALRGAGDMRSPMLVFGVVNVLNAAVSAALVFGVGPIPSIGVKGIVYGTLVARLAGGVLMLVILHHGLNRLKISLSDWRLRGQTVRRILGIGGPAALEGIVTWVGHFLFLMVISHLAAGELGNAIFAAHVIGVMVEAITYLPAVAWGMAAATMIGQSLGAEDKDRARRVGHEATFQCSLLACIIGLLFFFGATEIYTLMHEDPLVRQVGVPALKLLAFFEVPLVMAIVYVFALRGAGDTVYPLYFSIVGVLFVRVPLAYLFGIVMDGGLIGAWIAMGVDVTLRAIFATVRYQRGYWLATRV